MDTDAKNQKVLTRLTMLELAEDAILSAANSHGGRNKSELVRAH